MTLVKTTFVGKRRDHKGKIVHAYTTEDGQTLTFTKAVGETRWANIGSTIVLEDVDGDGTRYRVESWSTFVASEAPEMADEVMVWRATEAADIIAAEAAKVAKTFRKDDRDIGDMTIAQIAEMSTSWLPDRRAALVATVIARIARG